MNYLKISRYLYLIFGFAMLGVTIYDWKNEPKPYIPAMFSALAFFMYFFRGRFQNRFDDREKQNRR